MARLTRLLALLAAVAVHEAAAFPLFYRAPTLHERASAGVAGNIRRAAGYSTTLFSDSFNGAAGSLPSSDRWVVDTGTQYPGGDANWGTGEVETYTQSTSNLQITSSGTLLITPVKTTANGKTTWTSGRIESAPAWDVTCGLGKKLRIESRVKLGGNAASTQLGIWAAIWSLGSGYRGNYQNWPAIGEIDLLESINGQASAHETVHCGSASGGPCHETTGITTSTAFARNQWYTAAVVIDRSAAASTADWKKESISWLVNEQVVFTVLATTVNDQAAWYYLTHAPRFLLLNVAVGGAFPTAVAGVTTPTSATLGGAGAGMEVDYVAVYST